MDTSDLSNETYEGVLNEAEKLSSGLTLYFGVLADECEDDNEYLDMAHELTRELMQTEDWELDDLFFGHPPTKEMFEHTCLKILENIKKVKAIPIKKRSFDF